MAHSFPFAWEAAVLKFGGEDIDDVRGSIRYDTELTSDVEVFSSDDETNEFIARAKMLFTAVTSGV
jgi:hypothetical protein